LNAIRSANNRGLIQDCLNSCFTEFNYVH